MAAYGQPGGKRQKVREGRSVDNVDYFQGIDKLEYNSSAPAQESNCYRYYNAAERVHSKPMEDWMKCSLSFTEFRGHVHDSWSKPTHRPWEESTQSHNLDYYKRCLKAFFDLCHKLNIRYWTAFDSDLVPWTEWDEFKANWDEMVEYIQELGQKTHVKLLWLAPDLHSHPKYSCGAMTSNESSTFLQAAVQVKKCLEISHKLNAECFLIWPYNDGYDFILHTDVAKEIKLMSKLLKMTAEYKDKIGYRCQMLIMPYNEVKRGRIWQHCGDVVKTYMWDVTSCLYFLKSHNLERFYKVCVPPGHHMYMASVYNMLGGVTITDDFDHSNTKKITLMMKCIVDQGALLPAGVEIRVRARGAAPRELVARCAAIVDSIAKGIRLASGVAAEQLFAKHLQQRYISYQSGIGARLATCDVTLEECDEYYKKSQSQHNLDNSKPHYLQLVFQRYIDTCEQL